MCCKFRANPVLVAQVPFEASELPFMSYYVYPMSDCDNARCDFYYYLYVSKLLVE